MNIYPNDDPDTAAKKLAKEGKKNQKRKEENERPLPVYSTYKYSTPFLHEAVILSSIPSFISYAPRFDKILPFENIQESPSRTLIPPIKEEYPYIPYEFADAQELEKYLKRAKLETIDSMYQKAKSIVKKYIDQDDYKQNLLAIDIIWSYFQDKFGTTHYICITGENEGGKSSIGNTFEAIGYRVLNMTSPSAANIFRVLGLIEAGQCTIVLDESERISDDPDIMAILRSGYDAGKRTPKTNNNTWKQEWFFTYCLKMIIGEKSPSKLKAKGLLDRSLQLAAFPGDTDLDIKEVTNPQERASHLEKALAELLDFRNLMLVYRLIHFEDIVPDLDVGVKRRNKELCKPYIRLFYGSKSQNEVEQTFQIFLDAKNTRKSTSLEAILIPVIIDLVEEKGNEIFSSDVWDYILGHLEATPSPSDINAYRIADYTLYKNTITRLLEDKFGAESKHTNKGNKTVFNIDKLRKLEKSYNTEVLIKTKPIEEQESEGSEGSEGIIGKAGILESIETVVDVDNGNGKDGNISQNIDSERSPITPTPPQMPSLPSLPSPYYCYHNGCDFQTDDEREYRKHGTAKHLKNPLLYPSKFEIEKYGLKAQGKSWEI